MFDTETCSKANHTKCLSYAADDGEALGASFVRMGRVKWDGWQGDGGDVCHSFRGKNATAARCTVAGGEDESVHRAGHYYPRRLREKRADGNGTEKELGFAVWEEGGKKDKSMETRCINGKVKSRPWINYPLSSGITNVIIWTRVLIRMCRGVKDLQNKMGDRDGAVRV